MRTGNAVIEIGDDPAAVARRIGAEASGAKLRELQEQMIRLQAARITVAWDGGPALSVFDARGRSRTTEPAWRSSIRLTARFLAGLLENAVALDLRRAAGAGRFDAGARSVCVARERVAGGR